MVVVAYEAFPEVAFQGEVDLAFQEAVVVAFLVAWRALMEVLLDRNQLFLFLSSFLIPNAVSK